MSDQNDLVNKGDRNKIYFLVIVIMALLGTNAYLFFKDKQQNERFVNINTEKDRLKLEVEKIEVELDKVNTLNIKLSEKLVNEQQLARDKIAELKASLKEGFITQLDLEDAQEKVKELREFITNYSDAIIQLKKENSYLKAQLDSVRDSASSASERASELERKNSELNEKVKTSSALKTSNISIAAYRVKSNGKNIEVTKASTAKKLAISFDIVPNSLAQKDYHKIYLRVFDPAGNLIANENNMFEADGQEMQYSSSTSISFNDDDTSFTMNWINPNEFIKGTYSVILYSDGYTMGRSHIELR